MRATDARAIVEAARVDPTTFSFEGDRHEALCLLAEGQTWKVFSSERGERLDERSFGSEDEACIYFLKRLFQLQPFGRTSDTDGAIPRPPVVGGQGSLREEPRTPGARAVT